MSSVDHAAEVLADLGALFGRLGLRWYLFGAQAAAVYGNRRVTVDVDITVDPGTLAIRDLIDAMVSAGFAPRVSDALQFAQQARVLPVTHGASTMPVDVVLAGSGLEAEFLDRARELAVGALIVPVIAPEDLVIAKVLAGRPNDLTDVEGVLAAQLPDLDLARVREVLGLLEAALDRSDLLGQFETLLARAQR